MCCKSKYERGQKLSERAITYTSSPEKSLTNAIEIMAIPQQNMINGTTRGLNVWRVL